MEWKRKQGKAAVKWEIADKQSTMVTVLSNSYPKKACVRGQGDLGNAFGCEPVKHAHKRVIPTQQDILSAVMRPFTDGNGRQTMPP